MKWQQPRHTRKAHGLRRQSPASHTGILALSQHGHLPNGSRNDGDQSTFMSSNKHFIPTVVIVYSLSCVRLFVTPWTVARQAPLSMEFSRQEDWSELPFPSPGDLPNAGIKPASPELADGFFTQRTPSQHLPHKKYYNLYYERVKGEKKMIQSMPLKTFNCKWHTMHILSNWNICARLPRCPRSPIQQPHSHSRVTAASEVQQSELCS